MDIYNSIVTGLNKTKPASLSIEDYLDSLKPSVRLLRKSYYSYPVYVPYHKQEIQASYLIAYLPHYYQLIYSILNNDRGELFKNKETVNLGFIGGGPGSEVYGTVKFIVNNCKWVKKVNVTVFDINADTWKFSHGIVLKNLIGNIDKIEELNIKWDAISFNLVSDNDVINNLGIIKSLDLLVIQNCINEIALKHIANLKKITVQLFQTLPSNSYMLISDLTSSVRSLMKILESEIESAGGVNFKISTLNQYNPTSIISVHHQPNKVIRENLMIGTDGLIPRKNLKYDYTLLSRMKVEKNIDSKSSGIMALYAPLEHNQIDANDFVHTKSFIGLDFGTSTTVISCASLINEKLTVKSIPIPQKFTDGLPTYDTLIPTVMGVANGQFMVGKYAAERKSILELGKNIWYGFKENLTILQEIDYPTSVLRDHTSQRISNAKEALIYFFKYIKEETENYLKKNNLPLQTEYSVTIPAGFDYKSKQVIRDCLIGAEIPYFDAPFIEEPTAALINYIYESKDPVNFGDSFQNIMVLDIGAGTVDISIMQLDKQIEGINSKLLSVARQGFVGGNLLDEMIATQQLEGIKSFNLLSIQQKSELLKKSENLKVKLCKEIETDSTVNFKLPNKAFSNESVSVQNLTMQFNDFNDLMNLYWNNIVETIEKALQKATISKEGITTVILNGGGSRNPYIQSFTSDFFNQSKIIRPDNIQEHVSKGAALNSFILNSYGKQIVASVLNNPVCFTNGQNEIEIIKPGETLPTLGVDLFPDVEHSCYERQIYLVHNEHNICFSIPANINLEKIIVSINIDNEPECDLVTSTETKKAERGCFIKENNPLKIKAL